MDPYLRFVQDTISEVWYYRGSVLYLLYCGSIAMDVLIIDYIICKIHLNTTYNYVEDIFNFVIDSNKREEKLVTHVLFLKRQ